MDLGIVSGGEVDIRRDDVTVEGTDLCQDRAGLAD